jgi:tRNA(Ile2) C34 agmatinyltransferase TiaS
MSDLVATCPDCGTSSLGSSGQRYWCTECCEAFDKERATQRERKNDRGAMPTRGLAKQLAEADPDEVSAE